MDLVKLKILDNICYTDLVYGRINKKLNINFTKQEIEEFLLDVLRNTSQEFYIKKGKNYYITNHQNKIRITINSNTNRVITVDRI